MSRELRTTLVIMAAVLLLSAPLIFADAPQAQPTTSYLALVFQDIPTPTLVPPPISSMVIPAYFMSSDYVVDTSKEITNQDAAAGYHDPKAAASAFVQFGRETSWFILYRSKTYNYTALGVSDQVYRYLTPEGAAQGQAYAIAETRKDDRAWVPVALTIPGYPSINLQRTLKSGSTTLRQFLISVQVDRYVADVQVIGVDGETSVQIASNYAQRAILALINGLPKGTPTPTILWERASTSPPIEVRHLFVPE